MIPRSVMSSSGDTVMFILTITIIIIIIII